MGEGSIVTCVALAQTPKLKGTHSLPLLVQTSVHRMQNGTIEVSGIQG